MTNSLGLEHKAFLFQQAQELGAWIQELGTLSVTVDHTEDADKRELTDDSVYGVTFVIAPESLSLEARAEHKDFYTACRLAKEKAISQANLVLSQTAPAPERQVAIQAIVGRQFLH